MKAKLNFFGLLLLVICMIGSISYSQTPVPANGATDVSLTPTISWGDYHTYGVPATGTYQFELYTLPPVTLKYSSSSINPALSSATIPPGTLQYNTTYQWFVRGIGTPTDPTFLPNGGVTPGFLFSTQLATPQLTAPAVASFFLYTNPVTFSWTMEGNYSDVDFTVNVYNDAGLSTLLYSQAVAAGNLSTTIAIAYGGHYWWTVTANKAGFTSRTSATGDFTLTLPDAVLLNPTNSLTGVSILPNLQWQSFPGVYSYRLEVQDASHTVLYDVDQSSNLSKQFDATITNFPLANNAKHYWIVSNRDKDDVGYYSSLFYFTTVPDPQVILSTPTNGATVYSTNVYFGWYLNQPHNDMTFTLQLAKQNITPTESEWATAPTYPTTNTSETVPGLTAGKNYFWRIVVSRTSNSEVIGYSTVFSFFIQGGTTVVPVPSWPAGGATVYTNTPTLYWYLNEPGSGLQFEARFVPAGLYAGVDGNGMLINGTNTPLTSNFYSTITVSPGTIYYWQVRSYYPLTFQYSDWSFVESFATNGSGTPIIPIPSYPDGGVTVYTTAPTLYWYLPTFTFGMLYDVQYSTTLLGLPAGTIVSTATPDLLYLQLTGLTPGQQYFWRVRSVNAAVPAQISPWSAPANFVVAGGAVNSYPVLTWPIGNPVVYTDSPTLLWYLQGSSLGLTGYTLKYNLGSVPGGGWVAFTNGVGQPNETGGVIDVSPITTTSQITPALTFGGHYYWAVATAGATPSAFVQDEFTVLGGPGPGDPILTYPTDGSTVYNTDVTLLWFVNGPTTGIDYYIVQYSNSDAFDPSTEVHSPITNYNLTGLTSGATYYWKVRAHYTDGTLSNWAGPWSFSIDIGSPKVVQPLVGGPDNVQINTSSATLSWVNPVQPPSGLKYEVDYADNPGFSNANKISDVPNTNVQISGLNSSSQYYWRVRSKADDGTYSYYSNTGKFSVNPKVTAVENEPVIPKEFSVSQNYPNPFNPSTVINYALPKSTFVSIKIYNMLGQEVKTLVSTERSAGTYSVQWNGDNNYGQPVSSGTYIYRVTAGEYARTMKMILLK